jgi:hypothetical protein
LFEIGKGGRISLKAFFKRMNLFPKGNNILCEIDGIRWGGEWNQEI